MSAQFFGDFFCAASFGKGLWDLVATEVAVMSLERLEDLICIIHVDPWDEEVQPQPRRGGLCGQQQSPAEGPTSLISSVCSKPDQLCSRLNFLTDPLSSFWVTSQKPEADSQSVWTTHLGWFWKDDSSDYYPSSDCLSHIGWRGFWIVLDISASVTSRKLWTLTAVSQSVVGCFHGNLQHPMETTRQDRGCKLAWSSSLQTQL